MQGLCHCKLTTLHPALSIQCSKGSKKHLETGGKDGNRREQQADPTKSVLIQVILIT